MTFANRERALCFLKQILANQFSAGRRDRVNGMGGEGDGRATR